jgi:protein-S-isoprenylcysteine O-methyltransferase Ste14
MAAVLLSPFLGGGLGGGAAVAVLGGLLFGLGVVFALWAVVRLGSSLTPFPAPRPDQGVKTAGPYALVRHPMYGGAILIALGWSLLFTTIAGLALSLILALLLDLKSRREEEWLCERLEGYSDYRRRTPRRLLPFVY